VNELLDKIEHPDLVVPTAVNVIAALQADNNPMLLRANLEADHSSSLSSDAGNRTPDNNQLRSDSSNAEVFDISDKAVSELPSAKFTAPE
jgi:hypothetical protein